MKSDKRNKRIYNVFAIRWNTVYPMQLLLSMSACRTLKNQQFIYRGYRKGSNNLFA